VGGEFPFGLGMDYEDDWVGRYYVQDIALIGLSVVPSVAFRLSESFSLGVGVDFMYSILDQKMAVNNRTITQPTASDGTLEISSNDWGIGANLGLLMELSEGSRLGLTYHSPMDLKFSDTPETTDVRPLLDTIIQSLGQLDMGMTVPQTLMVSVYHETNERIALMGNVGWQDWSQFGMVDVTVSTDPPTDLTIDRKYQDTWHVAFGGEVQASETWRMSGGLAYDSSMVKDEDRSPIDESLTSNASETTASGLAAVWASENTRASLFEAMERRETYATTGPRILVRVFAGWDFTPEDVHLANFAEHGYAHGVPMGGDLTRVPEGKEPNFLIRALRDPDGANLDRVQIIKGWLDDDGKTHERIYDVAVSDDRKIGDDGRCRTPVGSTVNIPDASYTNTIGTPLMMTHWKDPDFDPNERAFYYVRVIEIPTPRWTAYDAKIFDIKMPEDIPMVHQERAYTSSIWYTPGD